MSVFILIVCFILGYVVKDIVMLYVVFVSEKKVNNVSLRENFYRVVNDNWLVNIKFK